MLCVRYFVGNGSFIFVKTNVGEFYKKNKHKYIFNNTVFLSLMRGQVFRRIRYGHKASYHKGDANPCGNMLHVPFRRSGR